MELPELFKLEQKYFKRFGEHFPNATMSADKEADLINKSLKSGNSYKQDMSKIY